jgi:ankyrin repeat protein
MDRIMMNHYIPVNVTLWKNLTPIWFATQYGHFHVVQNLLIKGANVNIYDRDIKMSCLDMALSRNFKRCAYLLLAYGARTFKKLEPDLIEELVESDK